MLAASLVDHYGVLLQQQMLLTLSPRLVLPLLKLRQLLKLFVSLLLWQLLLPALFHYQAIKLAHSCSSPRISEHTAYKAIIYIYIYIYIYTVHRLACWCRLRLEYPYLYTYKSH